MPTMTPGLLKDAPVHRLVAGDLEVAFLPGHGMLGASVRYQGVKFLRRVEGRDDTSILLGKRKDRTENIA